MNQVMTRSLLLFFALQIGGSVPLQAIEPLKQEESLREEFLREGRQEEQQAEKREESLKSRELATESLPPKEGNPLKTIPSFISEPWYEGFQLYAGFLFSFPPNIDIAKLTDTSQSDLDSNSLRIKPGPGFELGLSYYFFNQIGLGFNYKYAQMTSPDLFLNSYTIHSFSLYASWRFYLGNPDATSPLLILEPYLNLGYTYNTLNDLRITIFALAASQGETENRGTINTGLGLRATARFLPFLGLYLDISGDLLVTNPLPIPLLFLSAGLSFRPRFRSKAAKAAKAAKASTEKTTIEKTVTQVIYVGRNNYIFYFKEDSINILQVSQAELQQLFSDLDSFKEIESILVTGHAAPLGELEDCQTRDCSDSQWYDLPQRRMDKIRDVLVNRGIDLDLIDYRIDRNNGIYVPDLDVPIPQYRYYRNVEVIVVGKKHSRIKNAEKRETEIE